MTSSITAADIRERLTGRWPDDQYLHVYEAPMNSMRQGTKIDVLVLSLWASKGYTLDAVEIKVSYSDWCKEWRETEWVVVDHLGVAHLVDRTPDDYTLNQYRGADRVVEGRESWRRAGRERALAPIPDEFEPTVTRRTKVNTSKNADWRSRSNRFWIAAPDGLAQKVKADIELHPELTGWGVLAVTEKDTRAIVTPTVRKPTPYTVSQWVGLVRAAADCGANALLRAEERGRRAGVQEAKMIEERRIAREQASRELDALVAADASS